MSDLDYKEGRGDYYLAEGKREEKDDADIVRVGFTGTQAGMTEAQAASVERLLGMFQGHEFHHGGCVGADIGAAELARRADYKTIRHAGDNFDKQNRGFIDDLYLDALPNLERNHVIVDVTGVLIAAPRQHFEIQRSGTWATVRYARKQGGPVYVVMPDGLIT